MLAVMCLATFVTAFNENIINVALVDIMGTFSVGAMTAQWLVTGYMIVTSIFTACITLGPACGPVVSGLTVTLFGWRAICSAPLVGGVIVAASGALLMRNVGKRRSVRLNAPSLVLLAVGLTAFVFSAGELSENLLFGACVLVVALVLVGMFARRQLALGQPLLDIRPMLSSRFWPVCVLLVVTMMTSFPMSVLLPLCFEGVFWHERAHGRPARPARRGGQCDNGRHRRPHHGLAWRLAAHPGRRRLHRGRSGGHLARGGLAWPARGGAAHGAGLRGGVGLAMSPSQTAGLSALSGAEHASGTALMNTWNMVAASIGPSLFIGLLSSAAASATTAGASETAAQAAGFSQAVAVAAGIAMAGLAVAVVYTRRLCK